jgi:hypothetical protein
MKKNSQNKFIIVIIFSIILFSIIAYFYYLRQSNSSFNPQKESISDLAKPIAETVLNKSLDLKLRDLNGRPISLKYSLVNAKKVRYITKDNRPITLDKDKQILILSVELINDSNYPISVNTQDFVRYIASDGKKYAADYFNGKIDVAAISVRKDELAFIIDNNQKDFKFQIGEIDKDKENFEVNL